MAFAWCCGAPADAEDETLVLTDAQTAGIDGRHWDQTYPGALTVDAVHRSVLLRFPGSAERIAAKLATGLRISKVALALDLGEVDLTGGAGYNMMVSTEVWMKNPPRWHVVAWALRQPWEADSEHGPTFNAYIHGAGYWRHFGATDGDADRFVQPIGQTELSSAHAKGSIDVTACLTDRAYGTDLGERLRAWEERGVLLRKLEEWDAKYMRDGNAYEWEVPTGGCGIRIQEARLEVRFARGAKAAVTLPPPIPLAARVAKLRADGSGGKPTAVMPSSGELKAVAERLRTTKPAWMPEWQWQRVGELRRIGGGGISAWSAAFESGDADKYRELVAGVLATPHRQWKGWEIQSDLLLWYLYRDALPAPVIEHLQAYWRSWLYPDSPAEAMIDTVDAKRIADLYQATGDWRGNCSFFRQRFCYEMSTMNFNHTASMGALLGGVVIGSKEAIKDGSYGLDKLLLRTWAMADGSSQEMFNHYYLSMSHSAQKMFVDFGPTAFDRLVGTLIVDKAIESIASIYHPNLRRGIHSGGRARTSGVLVEQDGVYSELHTLSKKGVLNYLDKPIGTFIHGMSLWGYDVPPGRIALQSLAAPWGAEWVAHMIDDKPLPWWQAAVGWGGGRGSVYLGRHYGLGCGESLGGSFPVVAQWNRKTEAVTDMEDLGTLLVDCAINAPDLVTTSNGVKPQRGHAQIFQYKNRAIICSKPLPDREAILKEAGGKLHGLSTALALFNFQPKLGWTWAIDGKAVPSFPVSIKAGQVITIEDGVSYLGIIPLPATDLGRRDEITIGPGGGGVVEHGSGERVEPAMLITSHNLQMETPLDPDTADWDRICHAATGGFIIEMADRTEYPDVAAFQKHMGEARMEARWDDDKRVLDVSYESSGEIMAMGCDTTGDPGSMLRYRTIGGEPAVYLADGIVRDTPLSQQGSTGRLEKNGAVLISDQKRMAYLQTEPVSGTYVGYNPIPDPVTTWTLSVPGGMTIRADGRLGLARVTACPKENRIRVDYATSAEQVSPFLAKALIVSGVAQRPQVVLNGADRSADCAAITIDGESMFCIPLVDGFTAKDLAAIPRRLARTAYVKEHRADIENSLITDWRLAGPFASSANSGHAAVHAPEKGIDLRAGWEDGTALQPWKPYAAKDGARGLGPVPARTVNLSGQFERDDEAVAYAFTRLVSDADRDVFLLMGSDDGIKVWCNRALVHDHQATRAVLLDEDACSVRLRKGANDVLVKITQGGGGWGFCLRVADELGAPISGVTVE